MQMHSDFPPWHWETLLLQVCLSFYPGVLSSYCNCIILPIFAAFNRTRMASEGAIPVLIDYMKSTEGDVVAKQYCAMTLGNLAAEPENHMEIVKSEGIDALITVLRSEDIEGGRYAAFGLSNLAANANHRERIVEEGAVACLVSLACCEDVNAQRQGMPLVFLLITAPSSTLPHNPFILSSSAMAALRGLCISPEFRAVVVREGILDPLVLMSRSEDTNVLREVAAALNNLSSVEENKAEVADRAMNTIIGLMLSGDHIIERHAVCAAANLMEMSELNSRLIEERGVAPLVALASNDDPNSRGEACRCLANLSVNPDVHQVILFLDCDAFQMPAFNFQIIFSLLYLFTLIHTIALSRC